MECVLVKGWLLHGCMFVHDFFVSSLGIVLPRTLIRVKSALIITSGCYDWFLVG